MGEPGPVVRAVAGAVAWGIVAAIGLFAFRVATATGDNPPPLPEPQLSPASEPEPEPDPREAVSELLRDTGSIRGAVLLLAPYMEDTVGAELPEAAAALGLWAHQNMRWRELDAMADSSRAFIMKDPAQYRGDKLCSRGTITEIYADRSVDPPVYVGGLMTGSFDVVRFLAVRSTRDLVEGGRARFCGIFTGLQSYPNVGGGVTTAPVVVGMFDLPQNRY